MRNLLTTSRAGSADTAVIENGLEVTHGGLLKKAAAVCGHLPDSRRESVVIFLPNGSDFIAAFFAVLMCGHVAVPLNVLMTKRELTHCLIKADALTVVTSAAFSHIFEEIRSSDIHGLNIIIADGLRGGELPPSSDFSEDETAVLLATSGTTDRPKLVQLSARNIEVSQVGFAERMYFDVIGRSDKKIMLAAAFSSAYGIMIICVCLMRGYPIVVMDGNFTLNTFFQTVERYSVTNYEGSASVVTMMLGAAGRQIPCDISSLTHIGFGGSKVSGRAVERFQALYPAIKLYQGYGMTEAAPMITKFDCLLPIKPDSVGTAVCGVDVMISGGGGLTREANIKGEIVVAGGNLTRGYYKDKEETDRVIKNGQLYTGDIGYFDAEGYLYICGRKKNIIIVRGLKVNPEEVEECISESGLVTECVVYGKADETGNESIYVDAVPSSSAVAAEDIRLYCCGRLAWYKQPSAVRLCGGIKKSAAGKTLRRDVGGE